MLRTIRSTRERGNTNHRNQVQNCSSDGLDLVTVSLVNTTDQGRTNKVFVRSCGDTSEKRDTQE